MRSLAKERPVELPEGVLTLDAAGVVVDPDIDVVVEVIGGIEPARELILAALKAGKPVVTGNKELLANVGAELFAAAEEAGVDLLFEAAVAGGIPFIRPLRESLAGERIDRIMGIVNGTTNYILTRMTEAGAVLRRRPQRGPEPGLRRARPHRRRRGATTPGPRPPSSPRSPSGSGSWPATSTTRASPAITTADIDYAAKMGYVVKLLAIAEQHDGARRVGGARSPCGSTRRWSRRTTRWPRCATASTPCSSRATRWATSCSTGGAPAGAPRPAPCWAT